MRRIHTTFDLLEGHIIVSVLRAADVEAWLFDDAFVRQDWFKSIAYGGYRVMVSDSCVSTALDVLRDYKNGRLSITAEADTCPACGSPHSRDDPQPRRNVFLALIILDVLGALIFLGLRRVSLEQILLAFGTFLILNMSVPWIAMSYFKRRFRCDECGHRYKTRSYDYAALSRSASEGTASE